MNSAARELIAALHLEPLPAEGGYFRPTWRNATASAIFFLLTTENFSALHRIGQDELWHFYDGDPVEHMQLDANGGSVSRTLLGADVLAGQRPQIAVPARVWQGARLAPVVFPNHHHVPRGFALLGCTLSPAWVSAGFELARREDLIRRFPAEAVTICALTR